MMVFDGIEMLYKMIYDSKFENHLIPGDSAKLKFSNFHLFLSYNNKICYKFDKLKNCEKNC